MNRAWEDLKMLCVWQDTGLQQWWILATLTLYKIQLPKYAWCKKSSHLNNKALIAKGNLRTVYTAGTSQYSGSNNENNGIKIIPTVYPWQNEQGGDVNLPGKASRMRKPQSSATIKFDQDNTQSNSWLNQILQSSYLDNNPLVLINQMKRNWLE